MLYDIVEVSLKLNKNKCIGCKLCWTVCPHRVFTMDNNKAVISRQEACMECGACQSNCPVAAITVDSGVGCAIAIFNGIKNGSDPCC